MNTLTPFLRRLAIAVLLLSASGLSAAAPYVGSDEALNGFEKITPEQMATLREKKVLFASRSFGLNLYNGLGMIAKQNPDYLLLDDYERYNVFKAGGDLTIIPADAFKDKDFIHFLATYWPHTKRIDELDTLMRQEPWQFGEQVDVAIIYFHFGMPGTFDTYSQKMDALRADFPNTKFIYVTGGYMAADSHAKENAQSVEFNNMVKERYLGEVPLYDLGDILAKGGEPGFAEGYSKDPAGVHPDTDEGQIAMAKGFLVMLQQLYFPDESMQATASGGRTSNFVEVGQKPAAKSAINAADAAAVQALLKANNLQHPLEGIAVPNAQGRIVELYLQEAGVQKITADIGQLSELELLHCYGDRKLGLPLLKEVDPAIGKLTKLKTLLLNQNELTTLPTAMTALQNLALLSVGENDLNISDPSLIRYLNIYDPDWRATQGK